MSSIPPASPLDIPRKDWQGAGADAEMANYLAIERALPKMAVPVGAVFPYAGVFAPPFYLLCNGQSVSTASFPALFSVVGYTYGGSGQSFNVPDLASRVPVGVGQGPGFTRRAVADKGGEETHVLTLAEMTSHSHQIIDPTHSHAAAAGQFIVTTGATQINVAGTVASQGVNNTANSLTGISANLAGSSAPHNTMPPFLALTFIIRAI